MSPQQEPTEQDWNLPWDKFIRVVDKHTPLWLLNGQKPTEVELDEWEKINPGSKAKLKKAARKRMEERLRRERKKRSILPLWLRKRWMNLHQDRQ